MEAVSTFLMALASAVYSSRDPARRALRADAASEQALAGVDVAHAHHHVAVHDEFLMATLRPRDASKR